MLSTPLWIASLQWSGSIISRDALWPVVDPPERRPIEPKTLDGIWSALRFHQDEEDGHR